MNDVLSLGEAARELRCKDWQLGRLYSRSILPEPTRFAGRRVIQRRDLPVIEAALQQAGYRSAAIVAW